MHFSIPSTSQLMDDNGKGYTAYNIHINGVSHCTVRYKQLYNLQEQLKKAFPTVELPKFPPKKFLSLSEDETDERRMSLERFIQQASQSYPIMNSGMFSEFFLSAQRETRQAQPSQVDLTVYLMNGHKISVSLLSTEQTDSCLETVAAEISLSDQYVYYFGLFLVRRDSSGKSEIVRKLQDFESPYLSLKEASSGDDMSHKIVLRRTFWENSTEEELLRDRVAMNLLYVQAVSDVERGWVEVSDEQRKRLDSLKKKGSKKEYLQMAQTLQFYGFLQFTDCTSSFPEVGTRAVIAAGNKELHFRLFLADGVIKEAMFKVTRMRCWRITSLTDTEKAASSMELSFEYLMSKDKLVWITVATPRSIFMSMCLQGMVDELMMKKEGRRVRQPQDKSKTSRTSLAYMDRDGKLTGGDVSSKSDGATIQKVRDSVNRISGKFSSINLLGKPRSDSLGSGGDKPSSGSTGSTAPGNSAFSGIGDDDL